MFAKFKSFKVAFRLWLSTKMISRGTRMLPEGAYKAMMIHAFYDVNARLCEAAGQTVRARQIRQAIAPIRIGGRAADRARKRKLF